MDKWTHVDDALLVADHQVPEEAGLVEVPQTDHVLHPLHGRGVHDPDDGLPTLGQSVLLEEQRNTDMTHGSASQTRLRDHTEENTVLGVV